jgi:hypothetical protein
VQPPSGSLRFRSRVDAPSPGLYNGLTVIVDNPTMTDRIDRIEEGLAQLQQIVAGLANSQSRTADTVEALTALVQSHHGTMIDAIQGLSQQLVDTQIRTFESLDQM